jgi:hypothetical protein
MINQNVPNNPTLEVGHKVRILGGWDYEITQHKSGLTEYTYPSTNGDTRTTYRLSEVVGPYKRKFQHLLREFHMRVADKPSALDQEPWFTDVLEPHHD